MIVPDSIDPSVLQLHPQTSSPGSNLSSEEFQYELLTDDENDDGICSPTSLYVKKMFNALQLAGKLLNSEYSKLDSCSSRSSLAEDLKKNQLVNSPGSNRGSCSKKKIHKSTKIKPPNGSTMNQENCKPQNQYLPVVISQLGIDNSESINRDSLSAIETDTKFDIHLETQSEIIKTTNLAPSASNTLKFLSGNPPDIPNTARRPRGRPKKSLGKFENRQNRLSKSIIKQPKSISNPRSYSGCWTCRVRRKKCDENLPVCDACNSLGLPCDHSERRPTYMNDETLNKIKRSELASITRKRCQKHGN